MVDGAKIESEYGVSVMLKLWRFLVSNAWLHADTRTTSKFSRHKIWIIPSSHGTKSQHAAMHMLHLVLSKKTFLAQQKIKSI